MQRKTYKAIQTAILKKYKKKYSFILDYPEETSCCRYFIGQILISEKQYLHPTAKNVFIMLHEIGHAETSNIQMTFTEREFYATQWAIKEMKRYNFEVNQKIKDWFQDYIWDYCQKEYPKQKKRIKEFTLQW